MAAIYQIRQCLRAGCGLRYPVLEGQPFSSRCPRCRGETRLVFERPLQGEPLAELPPSGIHLEALLDNIRSAWNVGSMFRTADGTGVRRLHLCGITPTPESAAVRKTSLGAEQSVPWEHSRDGVAAAQAMLNRGARLWALEQDPRSRPIEEAVLPPAVLPPAVRPAAGTPVVLVVGNEVCGVDPGILELCEAVWRLPMVGAKRSFNVAVAFGIAAYILSKKT